MDNQIPEYLESARQRLDHECETWLRYRKEPPSIFNGEVDFQVHQERLLDAAKHAMQALIESKVDVGVCFSADIVADLMTKDKVAHQLAWAQGVLTQLIKHYASCLQLEDTGAAGAFGAWFISEDGDAPSPLQRVMDRLWKELIAAARNVIEWDDKLEKMESMK